MTNERTNGWTMNGTTMEELNNAFESFFGPTMKKAEEALGRNNAKNASHTSFAWMGTIDSDEMESITSSLAT